MSERLKLHERFLTRWLPHELRTPLTGIIGYADLMVNIGLEGQTLVPDELLDYGRNLGKSGHRLLQVAEDLALWAWLEVSRPAAATGKGAELKAVTITSDLVRQWARECAERYDRNGDLSVDAEEATVCVPREGFDRVVRHLIDNGLKFSLPGRVVQVCGRVVAGSYELTVTDRGRGMSVEEVRRIGAMRQFGRENFEQQGIGMGLALVCRFADLAGGGVCFGRNSDGPGMTVMLRVPEGRAPVI